MCMIFFCTDTRSRFFMSRKPLKLFVKRKQLCFFGSFSIKIKNLLAIVKVFQVSYFVRLFWWFHLNSGLKIEKFSAKIMCVPFLRLKSTGFLKKIPSLRSLDPGPMGLLSSNIISKKAFLMQTVQIPLNCTFFLGFHSTVYLHCR